MTRKVFEQITKVRDSGETNMFDVNAVMRIANREGWHELVCFLAERANHAEYSRLIFTGEPMLED